MVSTSFVVIKCSNCFYCSYYKILVEGIIDNYEYVSKVKNHILQIEKIHNKNIINNKNKLISFLFDFDRYGCKYHNGIHTRPCATLAKITQKYQSNISYIKDGSTFNGRSMFALWDMNAYTRSTVEINVNGNDEEMLLKDILYFLIEPDEEFCYDYQVFVKNVSSLNDGSNSNQKNYIDINRDYIKYVQDNPLCLGVKRTLENINGTFK